jgi:hypothetical protein
MELPEIPQAMAADPRLRHSLMRCHTSAQWAGGGTTKSVVRAIGLSSDQQRKMDTVFNSNKPAILSAYKTFLSEQAKLDALSKQTQVDQTRMFSAIDAVSQAKASLEKANTQMLLQIRQQMTTDQIGKLERLQ